MRGELLVLQGLMVPATVRSLRSADAGRMHLHAFVEFKKAVDWTSLKLMKFLGITPDCRPTVARGQNHRDAVDQGHFYAWAWKEGSVVVETSGWEPWEDYIVKGWWIDQLWSSHKLSNDKYLEYAARVRIGFIGRQKQVEAIRQYEAAAVLKSKQLVVKQRLQSLKCDFRPDVLDSLLPWADQYKHDAMRYKFLVLRAKSRCGKSTLAQAIGDEFGFKEPFVQTVQDAPSPDLHGLDITKQGYIVFDNVNNMDFILSERALFQSNNDIHTLGVSRTGCYSYHVWLYQMPIVVTIDTSAVWDSNEPWIRDNMIEIVLNGPCYMTT